MITDEYFLSYPEKLASFFNHKSNITQGDFCKSIGIIVPTSLYKPCNCLYDKKTSTGVYKCIFSASTDNLKATLIESHPEYFI